MSNDLTMTIDENFATKLGIEMVTPRDYANLVRYFAGTRTAVAAIGWSGIGKTAIPKQVAAERNNGEGVPYLAFNIPLTQLEDFHVPTIATDTKACFDKRIPRRVAALNEWCAKVRKDLKLKATDPFPPDMSPILAIEELNRAVDKSVSRAAFTLLDDRVIGDTVLDDGIQIVVTMNPTGGGMNVNEFEKDPAMRRRLCSIGVTFNPGDFLKYATDMGFHPSVLEHLGTHLSHIYDEQGALAGKAFACPATWESVSRTCRRFDALEVPLLSPVGRAAIAGAIGSAAAAAFLDFVKDHTLLIAPEDVLSAYGPGTEMQRRFKSYLTQDGGRLDKVTELSMGVALRLFLDLKRAPEGLVAPLGCYMSDLPADVLMAFVTRMAEEAHRLGNDAKTFLSTLNQKMADDALFIVAMTKLHDAKVAIEAASAGADADVAKSDEA